MPLDRIYRTLLENVVRVADTSGDGKLNEEEYLRLMRTWYNATESDATEMFGRLDVDEDGALTLDEMVRAATHFYLGEDPVLPPPAART
jgi:Ca2+-binding EF-hand superfamily protein